MKSDFVHIAKKRKSIYQLFGDVNVKKTDFGKLLWVRWGSWRRLHLALPAVASPKEHRGESALRNSVVSLCAVCWILSLKRRNSPVYRLYLYLLQHPRDTKLIWTDNNFRALIRRSENCSLYPRSEIFRGRCFPLLPVAIWQKWRRRNTLWSALAFIALTFFQRLLGVASKFDVSAIPALFAKNPAINQDRSASAVDHLEREACDQPRSMVVRR